MGGPAPATTFCLLLCLGWGAAFQPNQESGGISGSDYTDADITELGVLRAVAWFMERNPPSGKPVFPPGELVNLKPLTPTSLFKAYFKADISANRFVKAIQEVIVGNNEVEIYHLEDSSYHFHCEEIAKSITQFRVVRESMFSGLSGSLTMAALESGRLNAGKALHILQKFYSNSNWMEMGATEPYYFLVNESSPAYPNAPASRPTCRDCNVDASMGYDCSNNILVNDLLTSGFKLSSTCRSKPPGKCGHGGASDVTQNFSPMGGINKETSDPLLSPHHYLHTRAAEMAVQATWDFFVGPGSGLLANLGSDTFRKFFNLEGYSLTFAIDTTGSMSSDIAQVKTVCIDLIRKHMNSPDAPYNYILVPFNDPGFGPVYKTQNVNDFERFITNLVVSGGGDCPELAMSGLELALKESMPRSKIFIFTDAGAKDSAKLDQIKVLIDTTGSEVSSVLTGYCERSAGNQLSVGFSEEDAHATIEERAAANPFEELAKFSGGYYVQTSKSQISQVLGMMELSLNAAPVKIFVGQGTGSSWNFVVDETLSELSVSVKSQRSTSFTVTVYQPSGTPPSGLSTVINTANHKVVKISSVRERGSWRVGVSPSGSYELEIGGKSLLDLSYQIMEKQNSYVLPIQGRPVRGANYTLSVKVLGEAQNVSLTGLLLLDANGLITGSVLLHQSTDVNGKLFAVAPVQFHLPATMLQLEGVTEMGYPFTRVHTNPIATEAVKLLRVGGQNGTLLPGSSLDLSVLVVNDGADATFTFQVSDELSLLRSFSPQRSFLRLGESTILTGRFSAPASHTGFSSSIATFSASSAQAKNYLKVPLTVIPEDSMVTDEEPPFYRLLDFRMPCLGSARHRHDCARHRWGLRFYAADRQSSVKVTTGGAPRPDSAFSCLPLNDDGRAASICTYQSSCCDPVVDIIISDESGNVAMLSVDYSNAPDEAPVFPSGFL